MIAGALLFTFVSGTVVQAWDSTFESAVDTVLSDAGVAGADAAVYKKVWEFSDGKQKYDIHFLIPGQTKYEYDIDAATGEVVTREQDAWEPDDDLEFKGLLNPEETKAADTAASGELTEADAAAAAIKDAGLSEGEVTVTGCYREMDDGVDKFSVTFRTADGAEYEYDIDPKTGAILEKDMEYDD